MPRNENFKTCKKISKSGGLQPFNGNDPDYIPNPKQIGNVNTMKKTLQKYKREQKRTNKHKQILKRMSAHSGIEISKYAQSIGSFFKAMNVAQHLTNDSLMRELEGVLGLWFAVCDNTSSSSIMSSLFLYIRGFTTSSMTSFVCSIAEKIFDSQDLHTQSGFEGQTAPMWLSFIQDLRNNWKIAITSPLFAHFSKFLGILVTLKLCDAASVTFRYQDISIFEPKFNSIHTGAFDLIDAALGTITYFVEGIYYSICEGSIRPLISDISAVKMDEEYVTLRAVWDLIKQGNLRYSEYQMDEPEFDRRLERLMTQLKNLLPATKTIEHSILMGKITHLLEIKNDYIAMKISSGVRKSPFVIELYGKSSRGKTTMGDQMLDGLMTSLGKSTDKSLRCTYNAKDKFMSNWTTDKEVLILDDFANTKKDFVQDAPTQILVDVCNNQCFYAPKAELESKGKVFVEPSLVVVNTNRKNLDAGVYSNCPYSIQRRPHAVITVEVKEAYRKSNGGIDENKVRMFQQDEEKMDVFDDIWTFDVEEAFEPEHLTEVAQYRPISHRGKILKGVEMNEVMQYLCETLNEHIHNQSNILTRMGKRKELLKRCSHVYDDGTTCVHLQGLCPYHLKCETHFGKEVAQACFTARDMVCGRIDKDFDHADNAVSGLATIAILRTTSLVVNRFDWMTLLPRSWIMNPIVQKCFMAFDSDKIRASYIKRSLLMWGGVTLGSLTLATKCKPRFASTTIGLMTGMALIRQRQMKQIVIGRYTNQLINRNDSIAACVQSLRNTYMPKAIAALGIFGCLYGMTQVYKACRDFSTHKEMQPHGNLNPTSAQEIAERDGEKCCWTPVEVRELDIDVKQRTCGFDGLRNNVKKNLTYASIELNDGQRMMVDCLYLQSNVVLLPSHIFEEAGIEIKATFFKEKPDSLGGKFKSVLSKSASVHIPNTDMCVVYTPNGGSYKDLLPYLPKGEMPSHGFQMLWRNKLGDLINFEGKTQPQLVQTTDLHGITRSFKGGLYKNLTKATFRGMCGAPMISTGKITFISGFHLGGFSGTHTGCYGTLFEDEVRSAIAQLSTLEGVLLTGLPPAFETSVFNIEIVQGMEPHAKSPIRHVTGGTFNYHGQCPGMVSSHTDVKVALTSEHVMDVCGVPNKWGPPKMKPEWFGWQKTLESISNPADPIPHDLLQHCVQDYREPLLALATSELWNNMRPLTNHETLNGIAGVRFIDSMKLDTSIGFPLGGAKRPYVIEGPITPDVPLNRSFTNDMMQHILKCESLWKAGYRANCIAKACKKDEVLPTAKEKCRVFYGSPVALVWGVRKYFLPLVRMMQMNPLISECAVGINAYSPEWDQLASFVSSKGKDRIFGGDYKQYDTRLPTQMILAAFRILIDLAKVCDYTDEDLKCMSSIAGDIAYSFIAYNGDLISLLAGMGISGHALTVIINGICGSLLQRAAFYTHNPKSLPFREHVALVTYGDDNEGSSSEHVEHDNITVSEFLATIGMEYTMPDKSSTMKPFLEAHQVEFLKRYSVYHPDLGFNLGALVEDSIFKSLHCVVHGKKSPITLEESAATNIGTALMEWFCHGREVYEMRRVQMKDVARRTNVAHLVDGLNMSYDERVQDWKEKYLYSSPGELVPESPPFESQSGEEYSHLFTPIRPGKTENSPPNAPNRHKRGGAVSNLLPMVSKIDFSDWLPVVLEDRALEPPRLHCKTGKRVRESVDHMIPRKINKSIGKCNSKNNKQQNDGGLVSPPKTKDPLPDTSETFGPGHTPFDAHSGMETGAVTKAATADFTDTPNDYIENMSAYRDSTRDCGEARDAPIQDFFKRPVLVDSFTWDINTTLLHQTNVWAAYFTNARISNRINNYKLVRCNLHVKITINGNGFYYGRLLAAYNPLQSGDSFFNNTGRLDLVGLSQMPHVFVDPTHSLGGELLCPFFYPYDYASTIEVDWFQLGTLNFQDLALLQHANASTDPLTVNVFAWAEDMELAMPTMLPVTGLTAQSGDETDEAAKQGFISGPASAVARTAGVLSQIPAIRPYAMAAEMAASAVAKIARLFGYSRPSNVALTSYRPQAVSSFALGNVPDCSQKLSLDAKQAMSIDPRIGGMAEDDPLAIKSIASHESYLSTFNWTIENTKDALLFNTRVDPCLWRQNNDSFSFTSTALAVMPFQYWSGSMKFRFQICCSAFHKGRLAFVWDPSYIKPTGAVEYNTNYIQIIDIAQTQDFTLEIPNGQKFGMIKKPKPGDINASQMYGTAALSSQIQDNQTARDICNGVLAVYVLNPLTAPAENSPAVQINMFVSGGDDFEVHVPDDWYSRFTPLPTQSGFEAQSGMISSTALQGMGYNAPENGSVIKLGSASYKDENFSKVYAGETITTMRGLLKRYSRWRTVSVGDGTSASRNARFKHPYIPPFMGDYTPATSSPDTTGGGVRWSYTSPHLLHWLLPAFKGFRGSSRFKLIPRVSNSARTLDVHVTRYSDWNGFEWAEDFVSDPSGGITFTAKTAMARRNATDVDDTIIPYLGAGGAIFKADVNNAAEIELPFYTQRRFANARHANWTAIDTYDLGGYEATVLGSTTFAEKIDCYYATGDDFQMMFFVGLPIMKYIPQQPA